ncbi:MAG: histidine kinase dimerization/phospho-acceptor domain-containing protein, partial [Thomasclavelia ramosa]|nr:histidine kinase dimerization/phospho-acceptor domain-containing protein [Thomasclavelia ramosa]
ISQELTDSFNTMAEELENTEMLRTNFINDFSHEFKTPIVSIKGFAKLLQKDNLDQKTHDKYLQIIETESSRLADMATNVLNLNKIEK